MPAVLRAQNTCGRYGRRRTEPAEVAAVVCVSALRCTNQPPSPLAPDLSWRVGPGSPKRLLACPGSPKTDLHPGGMPLIPPQQVLAMVITINLGLSRKERSVTDICILYIRSHSFQRFAAVDAKSISAAVNARSCTPLRPNERVQKVAPPAQKHCIREA